MDKPIYCSRCGVQVGMESNILDEMTAGFYIAYGWKEYCDSTDKYVCDRCMWTDPRYRAVYGRVSLNKGIPTTPKEIWKNWVEEWRDFLRVIGWYRWNPHKPRKSNF